MSRLRLRALDTREAVLLGTFASLVVLAKAALRLHLGLTGHAMFGSVFLLVLARGCLPRHGSATAVGALAGLACAALGMGQGGPLIVLKLALPGLAIDLGAALPAPSGRAAEGLRWAAFGALAGATGFLPAAGVEALAGAPADVVLTHALLSAGAKAAFGAAGGLAGAAVLRRLREHGLAGEPPPAVDPL